MLIALLSVLLLGGGQAYEVVSKPIQKMVKEVVGEEDRADRIVVQMKNSSDRLTAQMEVVEGRLKKWLKADLDPSTGPETFEELMREVENDRLKAQRSAVDALFAMKSQMSRAEWDALFNQGVN